MLLEASTLVSANIEAVKQFRRNNPKLPLDSIGKLKSIFIYMILQCGLIPIQKFEIRMSYSLYFRFFTCTRI